MLALGRASSSSCVPLKDDGAMSSETSNDKFFNAVKKKQPANKIINQLILQSQVDTGMNHGGVYHNDAP